MNTRSQARFGACAGSPHKKSSSDGGDRDDCEISTDAAEDKELFKSFIRLLPRKDNYYLLIDSKTIRRSIAGWRKFGLGETIGVVATEGSDMIGYCNLKTNDLAWTPTSAKFASAFQPNTGDAGSAKLWRSKFS